MMHDERTCGRCGRARTRVTAQSVSPPGDFVQCRDCGHSTFVPRATAANPTAKSPIGDVDTRRIERLATTVIEARRLTLQVLSVVRMPGGWRVALRTPAGDFLQFDVAADSMAAMRTTIERALSPQVS